MAFAIGVKASDRTAVRLRDYWSTFGRFEIEPSMAAIGHPPHVTLAVYDRITKRRLRETLASVFGRQPAIRLTFDKLNYFKGPQLVIWAAPARSEILWNLHAAIHESIDPSICHPHYRPANWVPHSTLATRIVPGNTAAAIALASKTIEPFDVIFDKADCVGFYPVDVIAECVLTTAS